MKTLEHTAYAVDLSKNAIRNLRVYELEVVRHEELTFQLSEGAETDPDETAQLDVTHPPASFGEIG
jgi:hypothetical protein